MKSEGRPIHDGFFVWFTRLVHEQEQEAAGAQRDVREPLVRLVDGKLGERKVQAQHAQHPEPEDRARVGQPARHGDEVPGPGRGQGEQQRAGAKVVRRNLAPARLRHARGQHAGGE